MLIDTIVLLLIIAFSIFGVFQGFMVSILKLAAWFFGIFAAYFFSSSFAAFLKSNIDFPPIFALGISAILLFLFIFLLFQIAAIVVKYILKKLPPLTLINRILGGILGLLKGIVASIIFLTFIHILPAKGGLKESIDNSIFYSVYKSIHFVKVFEKFKDSAMIKI